MTNHRMVVALTLAVVLVLVTATISSGAWAQSPTKSSQGLLEGIIQDVIGRTVEAAREEVVRNTGIDPLQRGYDPRRSYDPAPRDTSDETRRELRQLNAEHDRKIVKLEDELHRKLAKARDEFQREAAKEDKPEKIAEKRDKLQEKVDEAYAKFEEKIGEENERFDEKRWEILNRERDS